MKRDLALILGCATEEESLGGSVFFLFVFLRGVGVGEG